MTTSSLYLNIINIQEASQDMQSVTVKLEADITNLLCHAKRGIPKIYYPKYI